MDLSLIISTWNNSKRLQVTLEWISRCKIPVDLEWELVLVNNNCTDNTDEIVKNFFGKLPLFYVYEPRQGLSLSKNTGLKASSGKLILFTDDDVKPCPGWIDTYWGAYQKNPEGFFWGGPIESEYEKSRPDDELLKYAIMPSVRGLNFGNKPRLLKHDEFFVSANWACPSEAFNKIGVFDINKGLNPSSGRIKTGEETDIMNRLRESGIEGWYLPEASLLHFVPRSKCTIKHVASRLEAEAYNNSIKVINNYIGSTIFGVPPYLIKMATLNYLKWLWAKINGKKGFEEYIRFKKTLGMIRRFRGSFYSKPNLK